MSNWNENIIEEFRANGGKVGGYFDGATMLLLHSTGRRTATDHVTPLVYLPDDGRWIVIGSKGGAPADPDWVRNLEENPDAAIEVGTEHGVESIPVSATSILRGGPEWEDLYGKQVARRPGFADYLEQTKGIRTIPVVVLERRDD